MTEITIERIESKDHYRFQVQPNDKWVQALGYNYLLDREGPTYAAAIRDAAAEAMEKVVQEAFRRVVTEKGPDDIKEFILKNVEPALQMVALSKARNWTKGLL